MIVRYINVHLIIINNSAMLLPFSFDTDKGGSLSTCTVCYGREISDVKSPI